MIFKPIGLLLAIVGAAASAAFYPSSFGNIGQDRLGVDRGAIRPARSKTVVYGYDSVGAYSHFGGDELIMKELKQRIAELNNPYYEVFGYVWGRPKPEKVYTILFNPGTEREGVHTIEYPKGSGNNVILAFESEKECEKFSEVLKDQQFFEPAPQEMNLDFLEAFCKPMGVFVQVVPEGMEIRPPTESVKSLGHNSNLMDQKHTLDYLFEMMDDDHEIEEDGVMFVDELVGSWE